MEEKTAVIYGTSVASMRTAANLGKLGYRVIVLNKGDFLDDIPHQLSHTRPRAICNLCLRFVLKRMKNVSFLHNVEIDSIKRNGKIEITLKHTLPDVSPEKCVECNKCLETGKVKVIYRSMGNSTYIVDWESVENPEEFSKVCPFGAINPDRGVREEKVTADVFVIGSNYTPEEMEKLKDFGYGEIEDVVTIDQVENWFLGIGPALEALKRPSDGETPSSVALIVTQGMKETSNCEGFEPFIHAVETGLSIKELDPSIDIKVFSRELFTWGKGQISLVKRAMDMGIEFVMVEDVEVGGVIKWNNNEFGSDLTILFPPQRPPEMNREIAEKLGVELDEKGCIKTGLIPVETSIPHVYAVGESIGHFTNIDSLNDASAVASLVFSEFGKASVKAQAPKEEVHIDQYAEPRIGVYVCRCALGEIDGEVLREKIEGLPHVSKVEFMDYLCLNSAIEKIEQDVRRGDVNRIVLGACSPWHRGLFMQNALRLRGIPQSIIDIAEIREMGVSPHKEYVLEEVMEKVFDLIKLSAKKLYGVDVYSEPVVDINQTIAIVGSDLSGLIAGYYAGKRGINTYMLLPAKPTISDELSWIYDELSTFNSVKLIESVKIKSITGYVGNYIIDYEIDGERNSIISGVLIVAGVPVEVIPDGLDIENISILDNEEKKGKVAIVCTGIVGDTSFSRVSCPPAIKRAIELAESGVDVTIFYSDASGMGRFEKLKEKAEAMGVKFQMYMAGSLDTETGEKPVLIYNSRSGSRVKEEFDTVVVSPGLKNDSLYAESIANMLGLPMDSSGFFKSREDPVEEINSKLAPNELATNGIFPAGIAKKPLDTEGLVIDGLSSLFDAVSVVTKKQLVPQSGWVISWTDERKCAGCGFCVDACGYDVRYIDPETKVAKVRPVLCQGCGACEVACPSGAAKLRGLNAKTLIHMMDSIV